jgi:hypothetical protein
MQLQAPKRFSLNAIVSSVIVEFLSFEWIHVANTTITLISAMETTKTSHSSHTLSQTHDHMKAEASEGQPQHQYNNNK